MFWQQADPDAKHRFHGSAVYLTDLDGDYLAEFVDRNADRPFFLYFSPFAIHSKVKGTPQHYRHRIPGGDGTAYEGAIVAVDDAVGKLLVMLKKHNLEENTLILNLSRIIEKFTVKLGLDRYSLYLMDTGAPIGFRLAAQHPERIDSLTIQNGNAYDEGLDNDFWEPI